MYICIYECIYVNIICLVFMLFAFITFLTVDLECLERHLQKQYSIYLLYVILFITLSVFR